jgi:hypothetical protein
LRRASPAQIKRALAGLSIDEISALEAGPDKPLESYADDPVGFCREILGIEPWARQVDVLRAVGQHAKVAVRSGHKVGKSAIAACVGLWWLYTRPRASVVLTSSSGGQLENILWSEVGARYRASRQPLPGRLFDTVYSGLRLPDGRRMFGISVRKTENMAGYSGDQLLFVADESSGIDAKIFEALKGNLAGGGHVLMLGNPTQVSGEFYDAFHSRRGLWHGLHIDSRESPNVVAGRVLIPGLATREWVDKQTSDWGEGTPAFDVRIAGNFPSQSTNSVVGLALVEGAVLRWYDGVEAQGPLSIGVDVARYGDDDSVLQPRRGNRALPKKRIHGHNTMEIAGEVILMARALRRPDERPVIKVDVIGVGAGVVDRLAELADQEGLTVCPINVAMRATDEANYADLRSQLWFGIRDWLRAGGCIEPDPTLEGELVAPTYSVDSRGRLRVESKDDIKKRLKRSPDAADALALAIYEAPMPDDYSSQTEASRW